MQNTNDIRRRIREARRSLSLRERQTASLASARHFATTIRLLHCQRVALYMAADGELDPSPLVSRLRALKKTIYLPILRQGQHRALWFSEYHPEDRLQKNRFGIPEPDIKQRPPIPPWALDLIIMPLVAFSGDGTRMGMGGGYYDRTLAYQRRHPLWRRPHLIGYGYDCQRVDDLQRRDWDIPLHGIITESGYTAFTNNR